MSLKTHHNKIKTANGDGIHKSSLDSNEKQDKTKDIYRDEQKKPVQNKT